MGGMTVLEWPLCSPAGYVRNIIPIATSARHSAWCISWGEAQRQSIYSDPLYCDGYYDTKDHSKQPVTGLAAARMAALLTYRSRDSFESRFGRKIQVSKTPNAVTRQGIITPPRSPRTHAVDARDAHNDGNRKPQSRSSQEYSATQASANSSSITSESVPPKRPPLFTAQSYLRYQGDKFTSRFDANCYIHISRKLDTHDLARDRPLTPATDSTSFTDPDAALTTILSNLPAQTLVISISSDGLFTPSEQSLIASCIPGAKLVTIPSPDGHDGFLLEFEAINMVILEWMKEKLPEIMSAIVADAIQPKEDDFGVTKTSMFGEAEADVTQW